MSKSTASRNVSHARLKADGQVSSRNFNHIDAYRKPNEGAVTLFVNKSLRALPTDKLAGFTGRFDSVATLEFSSHGSFMAFARAIMEIAKEIEP
jgi:hypothetical protein